MKKRRPDWARVDHLEHDMAEMKGDVSELKEEQHRQGCTLVQTNEKLDKLIALTERNGRARMAARTRIICTLISAISGVVGAAIAVACS